MKEVRLDKLLANLGYGSRREIAMMVRRGRITLDGKRIETADGRVSPQDAVRLVVAGEAIDPLPGLVAMIHKPVGVTCSHKEAGPLVHDLLPVRWRARDPAVSTVGRLDKETSGLLVVTDDGALLHRIIAPRAKIAKTYRASLARPLRGDEGTLFASGTLMLDGETKPLEPATLEVLGQTEARLVVTEGRYHQVRRMFAAAGNHVVALHREAVGSLRLPDTLEPGNYRLLAADEIAAIFTA